MPMKIAALAALTAFTILPAGTAAQPTGSSAWSPELFAELSYRTVGPSRGGRVTAVAGHRARPSTFYMGASGGGVWKTSVSGGYEGGVYKSTAGGDAWRQLTAGLPGGLRGKADLAVSGGDADRVYVLIEAPGKEGGVHRSDDRGESWHQVTAFDKIRTRPFYYTNLEAHPTDLDVLWGMTEGFWKSEDAGRSWKRVPVPHGDNHDMWINSDHPDVYVQANDGGATVTLNGGGTCSTQHNQPTAELYQVDVSDEVPYRLDQLKYLYQDLDRADQVPGRDAYERFEKLSTALRDVLRELARIAGEEPDR